MIVSQGISVGALIVTGDSLFSGNVGIGRTAQYELDVVGDVNYTGILRSNGVPVVFGGSSQWTTAGSEIYYNGNVGIGITDPEQRIHVKGSTGGAAIKVQAATNDHDAILALRQSNDAGVSLFYDGSQDDFRLRTYTSSGTSKDAMIVELDGSVSFSGGDLFVRTPSIPKVIHSSKSDSGSTENARNPPINSFQTVNTKSLTGGVVAAALMVRVYCAQSQVDISNSATGDAVWFNWTLETACAQGDNRVDVRDLMIFPDSSGNIKWKVIPNEGTWSAGIRLLGYYR